MIEPNASRRTEIVTAKRSLRRVRIGAERERSRHCRCVFLSRRLLLERLEERTVLSHAGLAPQFDRADDNTIAGDHSSLHVGSGVDSGSFQDGNLAWLASSAPSELRSWPVYGPLHVKDLLHYGDRVPGRLEDPGVDRLQPPEMPGLHSLDSDIAAAITAAWEVPANSVVGSWVVGLSGGATPASLSTLGFDTFFATAYLPDTYVFKSTSPTSVFDLAQQIGGFGSVSFFYPQIARHYARRAVPNDPLFGEQWHLQNTGQSEGTAGADANIVEAWDSYSGVGVVVGIVDDGLQHTHPDLSPNYVAELSFDFNDDDADPTPTAGDSHGTSCAGVAAAQGNNNLGVSGSAPEAGLAGLRLIAAATTDAQDAAALSYLNQSIDIYSNSWGPEDIGVLGGPGPLALAAMKDSVTEGRGGLGSIYVWAAGNGLTNEDNVNYDGYANSRYTIAVAAVDHNGEQAYYSEPGAPILVAAYSSGSASGIGTTTLVGTGNLADPAGAYDYTSSFGGTSSAAPLVAGVIALMLEANPNLTWRDVQHVLVNSAEKNDPSDSDWVTNGVGRLVNHKYGFGAIDADAAVESAASWINVPPQISASTGVVQVNRAVPDDNPSGVTSTVTLSDNVQIEHVEVVLNTTHPYRGDLEIVLTSPDGTESILAETHVDSGSNHKSWVFTSMRHWGESSTGDWTLRIADNVAGDAGTFDSWRLNVYGTSFGTDDFGDVPDHPYGTLTDSDGARHTVGGPVLGRVVDVEWDGQPNATATGDGADEDGVVFGDPLIVGMATDVQVTSSAGGGQLDYFVDFDGSGGFGNQTNEVDSASLTGGVETLSLAVPETATTGPTFGRFRISSAGGLGPLGAAGDGEVEDYSVTVYAAMPDRDFGDAPDSPYGTMRTRFGPSHIIGGPRLGTSVDSESDGLADATATGDGADEDGVHFTQVFIPGTSVDMEVTSSTGGGVLDFFFDFDGDGFFGSNTSEVFKRTLGGETETISVVVPADAVTGITYARFRISSAGGLGPLGLAHDGEVEDYQIEVVPQTELVCSDFEDFDDVTAPTLPSGWSTESSSSVFWRTLSTDSDTFPNHAFAEDVSYAGEHFLTSPQVTITNATSQLRFRHFYNMETGFDGGVLEISIASGPRQDILAAGGIFVAGGYDDTLSASYANPLGGRDAWSGNSGGYIDTIVDLPAAAVGQVVQFHWIEGTDDSISDDGWHIDTIQFCGVPEFETDFGDAPENGTNYPITLARNGARHTATGPRLGAKRDTEADGQPNVAADGDDIAGVPDDEDGAVFTSTLVGGQLASVDVTASAAGLLTAWIDFNSDGDWVDSGEQIFSDVPIGAGVNSLNFPVPATPPDVTYSRFRLSTTAGLSFLDLALDGEVEDYSFGKIAGSKWNDLDGDAAWDVGETGLPGWTIYVDRNINGQYDAGESHGITGPDGSFSIAGLPPGTYVVGEVPQTGWEQTYPSTVTVGSGDALAVRVDPTGTPAGFHTIAAAQLPAADGTFGSTLSDAFLVPVEVRAELAAIEQKSPPPAGQAPFGATLVRHHGVYVGRHLG